jgi:hypothetical protein
VEPLSTLVSLESVTPAGRLAPLYATKFTRSIFTVRVQAASNYDIRSSIPVQATCFLVDCLGALVNCLDSRKWFVGGLTALSTPIGSYLKSRFEKGREYTRRPVRPVRKARITKSIISRNKVLIKNQTLS